MSSHDGQPSTSSSFAAAAAAGPSATGYLDDTPNFGPRSLDLISQMQERAWQRSSGIDAGGRTSDTSRRRRDIHDGSGGWGKGRGEPHMYSNRRRGRQDDDSDDDDDDDDDASIASLDSCTSSEDTSETDTQTDYYDEEQQWKEAVEQIQLVIRIVLCPVLGKYMGRKWALWAFARYQHHGGLTMRFFGLNWVSDSVIPSWLAIFSLSSIWRAGS